MHYGDFKAIRIMNYSGYTRSLGSNDTYTLTIIDTVNVSDDWTTVLIDESGLVLEYPSLSDKFQVLRPCGLTIRLNSSTPSQFISFYTAQMQQYNVQLNCNGDMVFEGFLNSENFSEPYDTDNNYTVEFVANNGFAILERMIWTGTTVNPLSVFDVVKECITRLNYSNIEYLYISTSTWAVLTSPGAGETLLHKDLVNIFNFFDENGEAMSLDEVLDTVLRPYCLFLVQKEGNLYLTDHNAVLTGSYEFKRYGVQDDFVYVSNATINTIGGDLSGFTTTTEMPKSSFQFLIVPSFNKCKVKTSPYANTRIVEQRASIENEAALTGRTVSSSAQYGFTYNYYSNSNGNISLYNSRNTEAQGTGVQNSAESENFWLITGNTTGRTAIQFNNINSFLVNLNYLGITEYNEIPYPKHWLKVTITANFRTTDNWRSDETNGHLMEGKLFLKVKTGDKWYVQQNYWLSSYPPRRGVWQDTEGFCVASFQNNLADAINDELSIGDRIIKCSEHSKKNGQMYQMEGFFIPLHDITWLLPPFHTSGLLEISLLDAFKGVEYDPNADPYYSVDRTSVIKDVWVYDLKVELCDYSKNVIKELDVEKVAYFDGDYKDEMNEQTLRYADSTRKISSEKGSVMNYMYDDFWDLYYYTFPVEHSRRSLTNSLQNLYIRSLLSNYREASFKLKGEIVNNLLYNNLMYLTNNTDPNMVLKKFIISGLVLDVCNNTSEVELLEMKQDDQDITEI